MNYWLLTTEYPPYYGGGISTYCKLTAEMLVENGHRVSVFINDATVRDVAIEQKGDIRVIRFNPARDGIDCLGHVTSISYGFAVLVKDFIGKEGKPDIIEAQEYLGIAYYLLQFKYLLYEWCCDVPIIITAHSPSFLYLEFNRVSLYRYPNYWIGEMERFCLQAADHVISPTVFLVKEIEKRFKFTNANVSVIANPFQRSSTPGENEATGKPDQMVFFGKLSAQKGIFELITYFRQLWENGFKEKLYLIGGSDIVYHPEGKTMGDVVRAIGKKYIGEGLLVLEDKMAPEKIWDRLSMAKVIIIPSIVDNLPYVVLEMMSLGRVVLVSKQGGQREIVEDGINGFIFDHDQPQTFFDQLNRIISLTEKERRLISENARATIGAKYDFNTIYGKKIPVLEGCIAKRNVDRSLFPFIRHPERREAIETGLDLEGGLLSIVVPYYNMGNFIDETMTSLEQVEYDNKEIIIINDGSSDLLSLEKLERYRGRAGIRVIDTANHGLGSARNSGAKAARGQFLAFLDADDKVDPLYYQSAIKVMLKYSNVHFAGSWTRYFEGSKKTWPTFTPEPPLILSHNLVNSSALIYKTNSFLAAGVNDTRMPFQGLEDYDSVLSMLAGGFYGVVLPEIFFYYRVRDHSMIRGINRTKKLILYEYISTKHARFYGTFATELFNLLNANGPGLILDNPTLDYDLLDRLPFGKKHAAKMISFVKKNKYIKGLAYRIYRLLNK